MERKRIFYGLKPSPDFLLDNTQDMMVSCLTAASVVMDSTVKLIQHKAHGYKVPKDAETSTKRNVLYIVDSS